MQQKRRERGERREAEGAKDLFFLPVTSLSACCPAKLTALTQPSWPSHVATTRRRGARSADAARELARRAGVVVVVVVGSGDERGEAGVVVVCDGDFGRSTPSFAPSSLALSPPPPPTRTRLRPVARSCKSLRNIGREKAALKKERKLHNKKHQRLLQLKLNQQLTNQL